MVQFKENMIFQMFKDKSIGCAQKFKTEIKKLFDIDNTSDIYRKIVNYQIATYGQQIKSGVTNTYIKNFKSKGAKQRNYKKERNSLNFNTNKIIERNEV